MPPDKPDNDADDTPDDDSQNDSQNNDQSDNDDGSDEGAGSGGIDVTELANSIRTALKTDLESAVDSRITKLMRTLKKDYGLERKKGASADKDDEPTKNVRDPGLARVLRGAVRDEIAVRFDDAKERQAALKIAKKIADSRGLADDEDEDEVASEIVDLVSAELEGLQEYYETAQRADLERRGLLKPDPAGQQGSGNGRKTTAKKSPVEAFKAGQVLAEQKFGTKVKQ